MAHMTRTRIFKTAAVLGLLLSSVAARANSLEAVDVGASAENSQVVKFTLSEPLAAMPMYFATTNPHRLVVDLDGIDDAMGRRSEKVESGMVRAYDVVHAAGRTRVVLDLNGPATYDLAKDGKTLVVTLHGTAAAPGTSEPGHFASSNAAATFDISNVAFQRGGNGEGRIEVTLSDPGVGIDIKQKANTIQVDFLNTTLPQALQRRLDVSDFATPAQTIETFAHGNGTRMEVTPKGKWDYVAYQTGKNFVLEVTSLESPTAQSRSRKHYTGEKLSLDFQNVDVRSVLKVIADFTGMNIVVADSVSGNVTIRLKDVPWDQALDIILRAKGLDKRVNGNVIWVEQSDLLRKKEEEQRKAQQSSEELEPLVTRSYKLNYVRADQAVAILSGESLRKLNSAMAQPSCSPSSQGLVNLRQTNQSLAAVSGQGGGNNPNRVLSKRGAASYDLTTNTLIVTDIGDRQAKVEEVLKGIDIPAKQVMIEARIVLADDSFGRELGARLGFQAQPAKGNTSIGIGPGGLTNVTGIDVAFPHSQANAELGLLNSDSYNVNLPVSDFGVSGASSLGFTLINAASRTLINLELQALESDSRGKIISNPKVITTNLKPAVILQGQQIPYQTSSANNGTNTEFKDALLCLLVSPQVLNNNEVILDVEVQKDQPDTSYSPPAINVKRVETQVRVKNGETAILGGIFEQTKSNATNKVPLLGDIPVLGAFFRQNQKTDDKTEMLIFLTPRVLD